MLNEHAMMLPFWQSYDFWHIKKTCFCEMNGFKTLIHLAELLRQKILMMVLQKMDIIVVSILMFVMGFFILNFELNRLNEK